MTALDTGGKVIPMEESLLELLQEDAIEEDQRRERLEREDYEDRASEMGDEWWERWQNG